MVRREGYGVRLLRKTPLRSRSILRRNARLVRHSVLRPGGRLRVVSLTRSDPRRGPSVITVDNWCRELVFARDGYGCIRCHKLCTEAFPRESQPGTFHYPGFQWAHVLSARSHAVRWIPENSMCLCDGCHLWWHELLTDATQWWIGLFGEQLLIELRAIREAKIKPDRAEMVVVLRAELDRMLALPRPIVARALRSGAPA